jgi:hypothetical protein
MHLKYIDNPKKKPLPKQAYQSRESFYRSNAVVGEVQVRERGQVHFGEWRQRADSVVHQVQLWPLMSQQLLFFFSKFFENAPKSNESFLDSKKSTFSRN